MGGNRALHADVEHPRTELHYYVAAVCQRHQQRAAVEALHRRRVDGLRRAAQAFGDELISNMLVCLDWSAWTSLPGLVCPE